MAYTDIDKPTDYFNTVLYTGNGSTQSITGVGFQPDWIWGKGRTLVGYNHGLVDSVRGTGKNIYSNLTEAEATYSTGVTSFDSDGFSVGSGNVFNNGSNTYVAWNWLAGGTASSNTDGSITSTVSANTTSGFSIVSYTGNSTAGATVGHGLGVAPDMMIIKNRTSSSNTWTVYHHKLSNPATKFLGLNLSGAEDTSTTNFNSTVPSSSVITLGTDAGTNGSTTMIAYCFAEKKGFSKAFSYSGNGSSDGSYIHLGFLPAWVLVKRTDSANAWHLFDNKRNTFNPNDRGLFPNTSDAENTGNAIDFLSNGIKFYSADGGYNGSGGSYIGLAFASNPFVTSTGIPTVAR
jgi:hypothetical protein